MDVLPFTIFLCLSFHAFRARDTRFFTRVGSFAVQSRRFEQIIAQHLPDASKMPQIASRMSKRVLRQGQTIDWTFRTGGRLQGFLEQVVRPEVLSGTTSGWQRTRQRKIGVSTAVRYLACAHIAGSASHSSPPERGLFLCSRRCCNTGNNEIEGKLESDLKRY